MKRQATTWEKTFANDTSDKGVTARIHKEFSITGGKNPVRNRQNI